MKISKCFLSVAILIPASTYSSWLCWKKKKAENPLEQVTDIKPILSLIGDYTYDIEDALNAILKSDVEELKKIISIQKNFNAQEIDELKNSAKILAQVKYPNIISDRDFKDINENYLFLAFIPLCACFINNTMRMPEWTCFLDNTVCFKEMSGFTFFFDHNIFYNMSLYRICNVLEMLGIGKYFDNIPNSIFQNLKNRRKNKTVVEVVKLLKDL